VEIYAREGWYLERSEPEESWRGDLRRQDVPAGPAARTALSFALVTRDRELSIYAASVEADLTPFVGRRVVAEGKLVDLTTEGYGPELWLASIEPA
jgi:hypothetical protein